MAENIRDLLIRAQSLASEYLENTHSRAVAPTEEAVSALSELKEALPTNGHRPEDTLDLMHRVGSPATFVTTDGRYFGFVTGGVLPGTLAANWLSVAWDNNSAMRAQSPATEALESVAAAWILQLFDLPSNAAVGFVTGATAANLSGLAAARSHLLARLGWDVEARGLFGAPEIKVVVSDEVHVSVLKALSILGLGRERLIRVPTDDQGRMRAELLPVLDASTILCVQAGNVNSGAFDPAAELIAAARKADAWVHVDGAFGLWACVSPGYRGLARPFLEADSFATDGHKMLNVPYDSGIVIVKNKEALARSFSTTAAYLEDSAFDMFSFTPEFSRRARGIEIWAAIRTLGRSGLAALVERNCDFAKRTPDALAGTGLTVPHNVVFNQVMLAAGTDEDTSRILRAVQESGVCWFGGTKWHGRQAMRISFSAWNTTEPQFQLMLTAIRNAVRSI
ncbi:MAG: aminotransferase class V-fold PLP-dependent enzyme [Spirochaetia bacterium]|nr:aminotransferase class V-fold PLP-dependent enzyme [Spirochaetia bacterium]